MLGFDSPLPFTSADVDLAVVVTGLEPKPLLADLAASPLPLPAGVTWEYWGGSWIAAVVDRDATRAFTQSGHVTLRGPGRRGGEGRSSARSRSRSTGCGPGSRPARTSSRRSSSAC